MARVMTRVLQKKKKQHKKQKTKGIYMPSLAAQRNVLGKSSWGKTVR